MSDGRRLKSGCVAAVVVAAGAVVCIYLVYFHYRTTLYVQSTSPDGAYTCTVTEKANPAQCRAYVVLRKAERPGDPNTRWQMIRKTTIANDSCVVGSYPITWERDEAGRTQGVRVSAGSQQVDLQLDASTRAQSERPMSRAGSTSRTGD